MTNTLDPTQIPAVADFFKEALAVDSANKQSATGAPRTGAVDALADIKSHMVTKRKKKNTKEKPKVPVDEERTEFRPLGLMEQYEKDLEEHDVSLDQAREIVDSIITNLFWEEDVTLTKKLNIAFRTRTAKATLRLNEALKSLTPQHEHGYFTIVAQTNLASSLVKYGDTELDPESKEGFELSLAFVNRLPQPLFQLLIEKLGKFDQKINAVMKEGCITNF